MPALRKIGKPQMRSHEGRRALMQQQFCQTFLAGDMWGNLWGSFYGESRIDALPCGLKPSSSNIFKIEILILVSHRRDIWAVLNNIILTRNNSSDFCTRPERSYVLSRDLMLLFVRSKAWLPYNRYDRVDRCKRLQRSQPSYGNMYE